VRSDVFLPLHVDAAVFATGFVDDAPRNRPTVQVSTSLSFSSTVPCFGFCVMSGSFRWQIMYPSNRPSGYHMLNFIATDLQLYKTFKITRVLFLGHIVQPLIINSND